MEGQAAWQSERFWRTTTMPKKPRPQMSAEDHARREQTQRMIRERNAYHEAKAREEDERRAQEGPAPADQT
jgi:hypothetical protein